MMPTGLGPAGAGMADVAARVAEIRSRIDQFTGPRTGQVSAFELPTDDGRLTGPQQAVSGRTAGTVRGVTRSAPGEVDAPTAGRTRADGLPAAAERWLPDIEQAAHAAGIEPALLTALVRHESNFDPRAVSHAGAIGLAQLMPATADALGVDPHDPRQNLAGGARFLQEQLDRFGSVDLALAAYNAGPNRVAQAGGVPRIPETRAYVDRVMDTWEQLR